jgi:hypothetical protein
MLILHKAQQVVYGRHQQVVGPQDFAGVVESNLGAV